MALLIFCEFLKKGALFWPQNVRVYRGAFFCPSGKEANHIKDKLPVMTYPQYRKARKLVHECCNYDHGNCIALDDGEECICVQSISYSLLCKWFRVAVLPLDKELETALLFRYEMKRCILCGQPFRPGSNRAKYCPACAAQAHRRQKAASERRRISNPRRRPG